MTEKFIAMVNAGSLDIQTRFSDYKGGNFYSYNKV